MATVVGGLSTMGHISYGSYHMAHMVTWLTKQEIWLLRSDTSIYAFGQLPKNFGNNSMGA